MALIKNTKEIEKIRQGGKLLGEILEQLSRRVAEGVTTLALDQEAERLIGECGGTPSFKGYAPRGNSPYPSTICTSLNAEVVHAPPVPVRTLKRGDLLSIDIGMVWRDLYTDTALTVAVGHISKEAEQLMRMTDRALHCAIQVCRVGFTIADIGRAVEETAAPFRYGIVKNLVGHGVGHAVHEPPQIPNYYSALNEKIKLQPGMVLALEPMITAGTSEVDTGADGWTVITRDNKLSAHFEHTVVVTEGEPLVVTRRPHERLERTVLAVDFGTEKIGVAVKARETSIFVPRGVIAGGAQGVEKIAALAREEDADVVVVGMPFQLSGGHTIMSEKAGHFVGELRRRLRCPVDTVDERFTSREAERTGSGAGESVDERAAALIGETYVGAS